jgi:ClpP class serine protease
MVPQLAMSGGTMIACASKEIIMGKQSSLGPIDPQLTGMAAHGVLEEFDQAFKEITGDPAKIPLWQVILSKYPATLLGECQKSIQWSETMVKDWLATGMFKGMRNTATRDAKIKHIVEELGDHSITLSHARHISAKKAKSTGLKVKFMETDPDLQNAVMSVHHSLMLTFNGTPATKVIENHEGKAYIQTLQTLIVNK